MSEKGWWEDGDAPEVEPSLEGKRGGPEVEDPFQEDEGAVETPGLFVLRIFGVIIVLILLEFFELSEILGSL